MPCLLIKGLMPKLFKSTVRRQEHPASAATPVMGQDRATFAVVPAVTDAEKAKVRSYYSSPVAENMSLEDAAEMKNTISKMQAECKAQLAQQPKPTLLQKVGISNAKASSQLDAEIKNLERLDKSLTLQVRLIQLREEGANLLADSRGLLQNMRDSNATVKELITQLSSSHTEHSKRQVLSDATVRLEELNTQLMSSHTEHSKIPLTKQQ